MFSLQNHSNFNYQKFGPRYTLSEISNWSPHIFMSVLKVRFGYTKLMLININQCLAETLHAISFKSDLYVFHRLC